MQVRSRVLPFLAFLASLVAPLSPKAAIHATNLIFPDAQWTQSSPAEQGLDLEKLFAEGIAEPIGMHPDRWRWGAIEEDTRINGGAGNNGKGISINATELARLGWLFLNHGRWNGQQLVSSNWVHQATSIQVPAAVPAGHSDSGIDGSGVYGFNWWRNGRKADEEWVALIQPRP